MSDAYIGEIRLVAIIYAPLNWVLCDGRALPINGNEALYSLIGTTYGGDGATNFCVPDLRGRVPISAGTSTSGRTFVMAQKGGAFSTMLTPANIPPHTHSATFAPNGMVAISTVNIAVNPGLGDTASPSGSFLAGCKQASGASANAYAAASAATQGASLGGVSGINGGGCVCLSPSIPPSQQVPLSTVPPLVGLNYVICVTGNYPS